MPRHLQIQNTSASIVSVSGRWLEEGVVWGGVKPCDEIRNKFIGIKLVYKIACLEVFESQ